MSDVDFGDNNRMRRPRPGDNKGGLTKFLEGQGLSEETARKVQYGIIIVALLATVYFISQI